MPTNMRRMTIIVPDKMEEQMDFLKKEFYYAVSRSEMVRDLIGIGIQEKLRELNPRKEAPASGKERQPPREQPSNPEERGDEHEAV